MKKLKTFDQITDKAITEQYCDYNGNVIGYNREEDCFTLGNHKNNKIKYFETLEYLKECII